MEQKSKLPFKIRIIQPQNVKYLAIAILLISSIAMSILSEFVKASIVKDTISNQNYWYKTAIATMRNTTFLIAILWIAMLSTEKTLSELVSSLKAVWLWIIDNNKMSDFEKHLEKTNKAKKIKAFKQSIHKKLLRLKKDSEKAILCSNLLSLPDDELWDGNSTFDGIQHVKINYVKLTSAYIFTGAFANSGDGSERYNPIKSIISKILPAVLLSTILSTLILSFIPELIEPSKSAYITVCINVLLLAVNGVTGYSVGEYIVAVEKKAFLEYRISIAYGFKS